MAIDLKKLLCSPCEPGFGIKIFSWIQIIGASLAVPYLLTAVIFATQEYTKTHDYREALDLAIHIALLWCLIIFGVVEAAMGMILFIGVTTEKTGFMRTWIASTGILTAVLILIAISKTTQANVIAPAIAMPFAAIKFIMIYKIDRRVCELRRERHGWIKPSVVTLDDESP